MVAAPQLAAGGGNTLSLTSHRQLVAARSQARRRGTLLAPTAVSIDTSSVPVAASVGTVVGTFSIELPRSNLTATLSLVDDAGGLFELDGLDLKVAAALSLGEETIVVEAEAVENGQTYRRALTITVTA